MVLDENFKDIPLVKDLMTEAEKKTLKRFQSEDKKNEKLLELNKVAKKLIDFTHKIWDFINYSSDQTLRRGKVLMNLDVISSL